VKDLSQVSVWVKGRREKAVETKRGARRKRIKNTRKATATKKAAKKQNVTKLIRVKDTRELIEYCTTQLGRSPFQGAAVDFHQRKPAFVYLHGDATVAKVPIEELPNFLKEKGVQRVLVDALIPKRTSALIRLCEAGIEIFALRRPSAIEQLRRELKRHGIEVPKTDQYDAVLLAFTSPRKWMQVDPRFLKCWRAMAKWRNTLESHETQQKRIDSSSDPSEEDEDEEDRLLSKLLREYQEEALNALEAALKIAAKKFVRVVQRNYPEVDFDKDFEEFGIKDDDIAKAYYCEALLEAMNCDSVAGYLVKSGIGKTPTGIPPKRKRKKKFIHDGALNRALIQLAVKVYHLDPYKDEDRKKIKIKARKLAEKIWKRTRKLKGGRWGRPWGRPLSKREGSIISSPPLWAGPPAKAGVKGIHPAPGPQTPGHTNNYYSHVLPTPFFTLDI
jgi:hypothetical protein